MGVAERRAREKEELRQRILDAAAELFIQEGFDNVSIRKIADKIEYSPTTIYLHFKDKAELIGSICYEVFDGLRRKLEETAALGLPHLEMLRQSLRAYIEFGLENPNHYIVLFCLPEPVELAGNRAEGDVVAMKPGAVCFDKLRQGIAQCMGAGLIRRDDIESVSQSTYMMIHGVTSALLTMKSFPWLERNALIDASLGRILRGLGAVVD
jgi:AcrR family transcriptional regulator